MFIWDIKKEKKHTGNPYTNIIKILSNNEKLMINYKSNIIPFIFKKYNNKGLKKYVILKTESKDTRTNFYNIKLKIHDGNKNIYIGNISKTDKITGKEFVKLAEIISKKIGGSYVYLIDGTSAECKNQDNYKITNLSLYLLLKNNKSYYQKLGYRLNIQNNHKMTSYLPNKSADQTLKLILNELKKIKLEEIKKNNKKVLTEIKKCIINNTKLSIQSTNLDSNNKEIKNKYDLYQNFTKYSHIYDFLPNKGNLIENLIKLYTKKCNIYNYIIDTLKVSIIYNELGFEYVFPNITYNSKEVYWLNLLFRYRDNINWDGYFIKKI